MSVNIFRLLSTEDARTMLFMPLMPTAEMTASAGKVSSPHLRGREGGREGGRGFRTNEKTRAHDSTALLDLDLFFPSLPPSLSPSLRT